MQQDVSPILWPAAGFSTLGLAMIWGSFKAKDFPTSSGLWVVGCFVFHMGGFACFCMWLGEVAIGPWAMLVWIAPMVAAAAKVTIDDCRGVPRPPYPGDFLD